MGIYIGIIEKKGYDPTVFFNFKPIAEIQSTQVIQLTAQEQEALLPESEKRNCRFAPFQFPFCRKSCHRKTKPHSKAAKPPP